MKSLGLVVLLPLLGASCGFQASPAQGTPPDSGGVGGGGIDASTPDAHVTPPAIDAQVCFGKGVVQVCLTAAPTADKTLPTGGFNTDGSSCTQVFPQTNGPDLCVVAAKNLMVTGTVTPTGNRALVLLAAQTLTISDSGTVDASSRTSPARRGAAGSFASCAVVTRGASDSGGAGGGAGGSFGTQGGNGATGDMNNSAPPAGSAAGSTAAGATPTPTVLRGGCAGSAGGNGSTDATKAGGAGGDGGGAVYLIAGQTIAIAGNVFASGAGGNANANGAEEGGGGGGAGGMIGLDAPAINIATTGKVVANGGGGAGGGTLASGGSMGADGTTTDWSAQAAAGPGGVNQQSGNGGDGAKGAALNATTNLTAADSDGGGGGGGGGLGVIWTWGTITGGTMVSPAPVTH